MMVGSWKRILSFWNGRFSGDMFVHFRGGVQFHEGFCVKWQNFRTKMMWNSDSDLATSCSTPTSATAPRANARWSGGWWEVLREFGDSPIWSPKSSTKDLELSLNSIMATLLGTHISPIKGTFELLFSDAFPFPMKGVCYFSCFSVSFAAHQIERTGLFLTPSTGSLHCRWGTFSLGFWTTQSVDDKKKQPERGEFSTIYPPGNGSHIPPNGKLGKSSSQNAMPWGGYVIVPWRVTPFSQ